jgi:hypothetical protein
MIIYTVKHKFLETACLLHHKSRTDCTGNEVKPPLREVSDKPPDLKYVSVLCYSVLLPNTAILNMLLEFI